MEGFVKGDVVVVRFPFSDLTQAKRRPAVVLATPGGDDLLLCQVTSKSMRDSWAVTLTASDFETGALKQESRARPNRLFTAEQNLILYRAGHLKESKRTEIVDKLVEMLRT